MASSPKRKLPPKARRGTCASPSSVQCLDFEREVEEEEVEGEEEAAETQGLEGFVREFEPPSKRKLPPSGPAKPTEPEESQAQLDLRLWREEAGRRRRQEAVEQERQEMERDSWLSSLSWWPWAMQSDQFDGNPNPRHNKWCDEWQLGCSFNDECLELIEDSEDSDDGVEEE